MRQQKKQLIVLAILVIGLLGYLAFSFAPRGGTPDSNNLPPTRDPNSPRFRGFQEGNTE